jgi:hypothetical protein
MDERNLKWFKALCRPLPRCDVPDRGREPFYYGVSGSCGTSGDSRVK